MAIKLSDIFVGNFPAGQKFGARPEYYKQFGFAGHEGVDWPMPEGTPIVSATDGVVVRDIDDPKSGGYGVYVVVWDKSQNCATYYCHLTKNEVVTGQSVIKGQLLGYAGSTGNSTGSHLHFNLCRTNDRGERINTDNGYKGFINPLDGRIVEWEIKNLTAPVSPPPVAVPDPSKEKIDLGTEIGVMEVQAIRSTILDARRNIGELVLQLSGANTQVKELNEQMGKIAQTLDCPNRFDEILKEVKMLVTSESQKEDITKDPWYQLSQLFKGLFEKFRKKAGE